MLPLIWYAKILNRLSFYKAHLEFGLKWQ